MRLTTTLTIAFVFTLGCSPAPTQKSDKGDGPTTGDDPVDTTTDTTGDDTGTDDPLPTGDKLVGDPCDAGSECQGGVCLKNGLLPNGYCTQQGCDAAACPDGSTCIESPIDTFSCVVSCEEQAQCAAKGIDVCNTDNQCWLGEPLLETTGAIGQPCAEDADCLSPGAFCYSEMYGGSWTGFVKGYCMSTGCTPGSCEAGAVCVAIFQDGGTGCMTNCASSADCRDDHGYACMDFDGTGICLPGCGETSTCPNGYGCDAVAGECVPACTDTSCGPNKVCADSGVCEDPPCQDVGCPEGLKCADSGVCIPDIDGGPGAGPGVECPNLPPKDCVGNNCGQLIQFDPHVGPGYDDYAINGEGNTQWRSWARRDLVMLIKWATAFVDCKAKDWNGGNGFPLGLGDMSEENGAIPGTKTGSPGHPPGTHVNGYDMDIAYYQNKPPNNYLRPICDHLQGGQDQYHCVSEPYLLDLWRTSLFLGALFSSNRTRVIGVDGKVGALAAQGMQALCGNNWLPQSNCNVVANYALAFELTDGGAGWYRFHHHHLHLSLKSAGGKPGYDGPQCLVPDCTPVSAQHGCQVDH